MAKKTVKPPAPTWIEVTYDLDDLPSAQHKAGLAGLILQIEDMIDRREKGHLPPDMQIPDVLEADEPAPTRVKVRFSEGSTRDLFDDLYAASTVTIRSKSKWQNAKEEGVEENPNPGPDEPKRYFLYKVVRPEGRFLRNFAEGDDNLWHKLWRDMIFAVPRNKPTTRQAYKNRAESPPVPTREGGDAWKSLIAMEKARGLGSVATAELAGSLMLAVQAVSAEAVAFEDRVETQILLHFWVLTARIFVPQVIDADGKGEFVGYALSIPEVADLGRFCEAYKKWLGRLNPEPIGYRPRDAVIALPEQGPLELLHDLDRLATEQVVAERPSRYVAGIEFFHMVVAGNNVKLRAHGRIAVEPGLIERYGELRRDYRNPIAFAGLIRSLLRGRPWFEYLDAPILEREWSHLVHSVQERRRTPVAMIGFCWEVDRRFGRSRDELLDFTSSEARAMGRPNAPPEAVDAIIYRLVGAYVREKACARKGIRADADNWWLATADERRDVCAKLFLELRSRHGDEFVNYFADSFAAVSQWLDEGQFLLVSRALMTRYNTPEDERGGPDRPRTRDDVKTLTLLALSAHSRSIKTKDNAPNVPTAEATENAG